MMTYSTNKSIYNTESRQMTKMAQKVKKYLDKGNDLRKSIYLTSTAFGVEEKQVIKAVKLNNWVLK